jgi:predicted heme/steroid binding protein
LYLKTQATDKIDKPNYSFNVLNILGKQIVSHLHLWQDIQNGGTNMRKRWFAILLGSIILLSACASPSPSAPSTPSNNNSGFANSNGSSSNNQNTDDLPVFTLEELKKFDGMAGNKAYVAIDGIVYDVTLVSVWANGVHQGNVAGNDLTTRIEQSPHGKSVLRNLPIVGTLE